MYSHRTCQTVFETVTSASSLNYVDYRASWGLSVANLVAVTAEIASYSRNSCARNICLRPTIKSTRGNFPGGGSSLRVGGSGGHPFARASSRSWGKASRALDYGVGRVFHAHFLASWPPSRSQPTLLRLGVSASGWLKRATRPGRVHLICGSRLEAEDAAVKEATRNYAFTGALGNTEKAES